MDAARFSVTAEASRKSHRKFRCTPRFTRDATQFPTWWHIAQQILQLTARVRTLRKLLWQLAELNVHMRLQNSCHPEARQTELTDHFDKMN